MNKDYFTQQQINSIKNYSLATDIVTDQLKKFAYSYDLVTELCNSSWGWLGVSLPEDEKHVLDSK